MSDPAGPDGWDAWAAIEACQVYENYEGSTWRAHWRGYSAVSWEGALHSSARYNCGPVGSIYTKLGNVELWSTYIGELCDQCRALRALKEELAAAGL